MFQAVYFCLLLAIGVTVLLLKCVNDLIIPALFSIIPIILE